MSFKDPVDCFENAALAGKVCRTTQYVLKFIISASL